MLDDTDRGSDIATRKYTLTLFPNEQASSRLFWTGTLAELEHNIFVTAADDKSKLPWLKLAGFGDNATPKGSYRSNANMTWVAGVEGDYDGGELTIDQAADLFRRARLRVLLYTTPSNTDDKPRWRALCPASRQLPPAERDALMNHLNGTVGGGFAPESWTCSQSYYYGNVTDRAPVRVQIVDGDHIDTRPDLPSLPRPGGCTETREHPDVDVSPAAPISVETLRAMGEAAAVACADLHYPELRTVMFGVTRIPVEGDDDHTIRAEVARSIWNANTTSESLTDDKFEALLTEAPRFNGDGSMVGPGTFVYYARQGGWSDAVPDEKRYAGILSDLPEGTAEAVDDGGPVTLNTTTLDNRHVSAAWVSYSGEMVEPPPVAEIIPKWAEKHVMTFDEGGAGIGKSYIAEQESACVAAGHPVLGEAVEQTDVLYLNYEEPRAEFDRRLYRIKQALGQWYLPDGRSQLDWCNSRTGVWHQDVWPKDQVTFRPLDTSRLSAIHLRNEEGAHLLRVARNGDIIITRFGRHFLGMLARSGGGHRYVVFDGLMDAILFEGSTRSEDDVARQVIALLDRWCVEYNFTGRGIMHPSRTGERTGTDSYAPAWTTKPRALNQYRRVTIEGKSPTVNTPPQEIFTRRIAAKRSHGEQHYYADMRYSNGLFRGGVSEGGEDAIDVAVDIALRHDDIGGRIKKDGTIGTEKTRLSNQHQIIAEYRRRTGEQHGAPHFLGSLEEAEQAGRIVYMLGRSHTVAGYARPPTAPPLEY